MSLDHFPANIEHGIELFAHQQHLSHDEAVVRLVETGLMIAKPEQHLSKTAHRDVYIAGLPKEPMSDADAAIMDEIIAEAMEARARRWEQNLHEQDIT